MPAITSLAISAAAPLVRTVAALGARAGRSLKRVAKLMRHRQEFRRLAAFDDRMLKDIGLSRGDLQTAYDEPLWRDPTDILARRQAERWLGRTRAGAPCEVANRPRPVLRCPSLSRSPRFLI